MIQDRFRGKTWIFWAQLLVCGGLGLFSVPMGVLFWTSLLTDAHGEARPQAGPPLVIIGSGLLAVALLASFNIVGRIPPLARCYREGIECNLVGATSLDGVPLVPGLVRVAWTIVSLQGFRSQRLRVAWSEFGGAYVGGMPMAHLLTLTGAFVNLKNGRVSQAITFQQVAMQDHPQQVAEVLNFLSSSAAQRETLSPWPLPSASNSTATATRLMT